MLAMTEEGLRLLAAGADGSARAMNGTTPLHVVATYSSGLGARHEGKGGGVCKRPADSGCGPFHFLRHARRLESGVRKDAFVLK